MIGVAVIIGVGGATLRLWNCGPFPPSTASGVNRDVPLRNVTTCPGPSVRSRVLQYYDSDHAEIRAGVEGFDKGQQGAVDRGVYAKAGTLADDRAVDDGHLRRPTAQHVLKHG